jgi:hypothetical protein
MSIQFLKINKLNANPNLVTERWVTKILINSVVMQMINQPKLQDSTEETRSDVRKIFRCTANIVLETGAIVVGRTVDISTVGISIMTPSALARGVCVRVDLSSYENRRVITLNVSAKVKYCICVGTTGFRIGFEFVQVDAATARTISKLSLG